jgi:Protein of unknown function (DUF2905)
VPRSAGPILVVVGAAIVVIGLVVWTGLFSWFGRLPGDIRVERENVRIYVPITSMLLVSIVITAIGAIVRRLR